MELKIIRKFKKSSYTIGNLFIDNKYFCDTLEDKDRSLIDSMSVSDIKATKVYGKTAIPSGTYKVDLNTVSPKFKNKSWAIPYNGKIPRLLNVKGFDGILIHPGNTHEDTYGCILVGYNKSVGKVINSTATFHELMKAIKNREVTITIE